MAQASMAGPSSYLIACNYDGGQDMLLKVISYTDTRYIKSIDNIESVDWRDVWIKEALVTGFVDIVKIAPIIFADWRQQ
jgi:hypothetical protein